MGKTRLAKATMYKICKDVGANRVSRGAAEVLARVIEETCIRIAKEAMDYARHAGRITIKAEDIEIAANKILGK